MWKDSVKQKLEHRLAAYGQGQLLRFWDELDHTQRQSLAAQIHGLDLELVDRLFQNRDMEGDIRALASRAGSPPGVRLSPETGTVFSNPPPQVARQAGREALAAGEIAAILVAGGQGTRLGFGYPKAMFPIGPVSRNSLLQILIEKVLAVSRRFGVPMPLGIMTSPATDGQIRKFLAEHGRFGLPEDDVLFFCQGTMPAVDAQTGKVLLVARDRVALSPDGHGGLLAAVASSGVLDELAQRGIRTLFYFQVDNPLVQFGSAEFIGYHRLAGSELSTQVIAKQSPMERVGNVVEVDGRLRVIEYSDLPDDVGERRAADGSLPIWAGSIAVHLMELAFLRRMADQAEALPFHRAHKKVSYISEEGRRIEPEEPNALKFERFIFDLIPSARNAIVVEIDRNQGFAPLKNAAGAADDTPEHVQKQMIAEHRRWLMAAGATVGENVSVEISPLFALDAEDAARKITPGTQVTQDTYFH
jgi:UDP-N-acetylglucosamine/UDP-N-acetylgalactosamine diphosphorylase